MAERAAAKLANAHEFITETQKALDRLMKDKTSIVIAHHLATIVRADTIFVVKDAQLAERGTHDELLAAGGFYAELYNIQFGESAPALA